MAISVRPTKWSFRRLFCEVFGPGRTQHRLMEWATDNHLLPTEKFCVCGRSMTLVKNWKIAKGYFQCRADGRQVPWVQGTIFDPDSTRADLDSILWTPGTIFDLDSIRAGLDSTLWPDCSEEQIVLMTLGFVRFLTVNKAEAKVPCQFIDKRCVYHFFCIFEQAISEWLYRELTPLTGYVGGPGTVVQAIPTEFSRRKKSPSTILAGTILVLIEDGSTRFSIMLYPGELTYIQETFAILQNKIQPGTTIVIPDTETFAGLDTNRLYKFSNDLDLLSRPYKNVMEDGTNLHRVCTGDDVMCHIFGIYCDLLESDMFEVLVTVLSNIYPGY